MWRSCGTYLWNKFRGLPGFCAFAEPCHEKLLFSTSATFQKEMEEGVAAKLRHPPLDQHYFAEFPFEPAGGVRFFQKRFSFENYYLAEDAADTELEQYLAYLATYARQQNRRPLAKFCRFGLRTAWMKRVLGPTAIYVVREPDAMFRSYWSLSGQNSYFLYALLLILSKNRRCLLFREFADELALPEINRATVAEECVEAYKISQRLDAQALRDVFLLFWSLTLKHNLAHADLVFSIDGVATDAAYREQTSEHLEELIGIRIAMDDAHRPVTAPAPGILFSPRGRELIRRAVSFFPYGFDSPAVHKLSPETKAAIEAVS
jgi:hypothetical protein